MYKINQDRKMWDLWAKRWDFLLSIIGYDIAYRKEAIDRLSLNRGSIVLDLACGTGLNFEHIEEKIGIKGKITDDKSLSLEFLLNNLDLGFLWSKIRHKYSLKGWVATFNCNAMFKALLIKEKK